MSIKSRQCDSRLRREKGTPRGDNHPQILWSIALSLPIRNVTYLGFCIADIPGFHSFPLFRSILPSSACSAPFQKSRKPGHKRGRFMSKVGNLWTFPLGVFLGGFENGGWISQFWLLKSWLLWEWCYILPHPPQQKVKMATTCANFQATLASSNHFLWNLLDVEELLAPEVTQGAPPYWYGWCKAMAKEYGQENTQDLCIRYYFIS